MEQAQTLAPAASLYDRLGGETGLRRLIGDIVDTHLANPNIGVRFAPHDLEALKERSFLFFGQATGGPQEYLGRGLRETHRGMNVNEHEFVAATDDVLAVLRNHGVGQAEQLEVLGAFFALKDEVLHL